MSHDVSWAFDLLIQIDLKRAGPDGKIPPVPRANQIAEFSELLCSRVVDGKVMLEQKRYPLQQWSSTFTNEFGLG